MVQEKKGVDLLDPRTGDRPARHQVADIVAMGGVLAQDGTRLKDVCHSSHIERKRRGTSAMASPSALTLRSCDTKAIETLPAIEFTRF